MAWSPSTLHGNPKRGIGILNNGLYIGRLVWNRQDFVKDPDTGKRIARLNPESEWITADVPELQIIDAETWQGTRTRQAATRRAISTGIVRARQPKYLFSGLTKCSACGGGYILSSRDTLRCFNASSRGTCSNTRTITRHEVESRVLGAMRTQLFDPGHFEIFCQGFAARVEERRREHLASVATKKRELERIKREIRKLIDAIKAGVAPLELKDEMEVLHRQKEVLSAQLAHPRE